MYRPPGGARARSAGIGGAWLQQVLRDRDGAFPRNGCDQAGEMRLWKRGKRAGAILERLACTGAFQFVTLCAGRI